LQGSRDGIHRAGKHRGRGQAAGNFLCMVGAGQHREPVVHALSELAGQHFTGTAPGVQLQSFGADQQERVLAQQGGELPGQGAQSPHRGGDEDDRRVAHGGREVGGGRDAGGQSHTGQVGGVFAGTG
jgi:hypothetical protein